MHVMAWDEDSREKVGGCGRKRGSEKETSSSRSAQKRSRELKVKKRPEFTSTLQQRRQRLMVGQREVQVASTSKLLLMNYWECMKETHFFPLFLSFYLPSASFSSISGPLVPVPAAVMGSSSCDLACRHADRRVYCSAVALPKLQGPPA